MSYKTKAALLGLLPLNVLLLPMAHALETSYQIGMDVEYTDNIDKTEIETKDETTASLWADIAAQGEGANYELNAYARLEQRHYIENTNEDNTLGRLNGSMVWHIAPQRFSWLFADYLNYAKKDLQRSLTPSNIQQVNFFVTGPRILLRPSRLDRVESELLFIDYSEEDTREDSQRTFGKVSWHRRINALSELGVVGELLNTKFEDSSESERDYRLSSAYLQYEWRRGFTGLTVDLGASQAEYDTDSSRDRDTELARLAWQYRPSSLLDVGFAIGRQLSDDQQSELASRQAGQVVQETDASGIFVEDYVIATLNRQQRGTSITGELQYRAREGDNTSENSDDTTALFSYRTLLGARFGFDASLSYNFKKFSSILREDDEWNADVGVTYFFNRALRLRASVEGFSTKSVGRDKGREFDETLVGLSLIYQPRPALQPRTPIQTR